MKNSKLNYKESAEILKEINGAKKILVNCHRGPDSDSVGSALAMAGVLGKMGKDVSVVCPSVIPEDLKFLGTEMVKQVDFSNFNFSEYDLFLVLDSSNYSMVTGSKELDKPQNPPMIVIDHHFSNPGFGKINLIDSAGTSTAELLFKVFEDWGVELNKEISECLLTGIIGDTGSFQYQNVGAETLEIAAKLIKLGADKDKIIYQIYRNISFSEVKIWGKIIENMEIDREHHFVWSLVPVSIYGEFVGSESVKEDAANMFFPIVKDTDFGIIMEEREDNVLSISFRSRSGFDVSKIAKEVGGGGHKPAAGARIEGLPYDKAVEKVLAAARKYARKD